MREFVFIGGMLLSGMAFLVSFTTRGTDYVQEREAYYLSLASEAIKTYDMQKGAIYRNLVDEVLYAQDIEYGWQARSFKRCLEGHYPRMTSWRVLGASAQDNRQWHIANERACLGGALNRYQGDGNQVAVDAIDRIMLPTR